MPCQIVVTGDGSLTLRHPDNEETYHSTFGALTESTSVFLQNSGTLARLKKGVATRVLEIGFGTGLNFLLTAKAAQAADCPLEYVAVEIDPIADNAFSELLIANFPDQHQLVENSIAAVKGFKNLASPASPSAKDRFGTDQDLIAVGKSVKLQLIIGDAITVPLGCGFNAVYLDAFSPKNNPQLWTAPFLNKLREVLAADALLVSYCVNRQFRDGLTEAGYQWRKVEGPPGKREVLIANSL